MEIAQRHIEARFGGCEYLAGGNNIHPQPLLRHDAVDLLEGVGLAGIEHPEIISEGGAEGGHILPAVMADAVFIHQVQRSSAARGQSADILSGEIKAAAPGGNIGTDKIHSIISCIKAFLPEVLRVRGLIAWQGEYRTCSGSRYCLRRSCAQRLWRRPPARRR